MKTTSPTTGIASHAKLSAHQLEGIHRSLGRNPTSAELDVFAALWGQSPSLGLQEFGSPLDWNGNRSIVMDIHSMAYEPAQPAAFGVAASIVSMGARPIAALSSIVSSPPSGSSHPLVEGVEQLSAYTRSLGIPMVGGETCFSQDHKGLPYISVLCVGIGPTSRLLQTASVGDGCMVCLLEAPGSGKIDGPDTADGPLEHIMLEAILEMNGLGLLQGVSPVSPGSIAAALLSKLRGDNLGVRLWANRIRPQASPSNVSPVATPRPRCMLLLVTDGCEEDANRTATKWGLTCTIIGETTGSRRFEVMDGEAPVVDLPFASLSGDAQGAPPPASPSGVTSAPVAPHNINTIAEPKDLKEVALTLVAHPNIASKRRLFELFDSMIGNSNLGVNFPLTSAAIRIDGENKGLAINLCSATRYLKADAELGATIAIAQAVRGILCAGAHPMGIALSIPRASEYSGAEGVRRGIARASASMSIPIVLGKEQPMAPAIGLVGVLNGTGKLTTQAFKAKGHMIYLIGHSRNDIGSSQYLECCHGVSPSPPPYFSMDEELALQSTLKDLLQAGLIVSANNVSDGGLFMALLESAMPQDLGFDITTDAEVRTDAFLFGEAQGRAIISVSEAQEGDFIDFMMGRAVPLTALGHVTKSEIRIDDVSYGFIADLKNLYANTLRP